MSDPNAAPDPAQRGARTPEPGAHVWGPQRIVCLTEETTEWLYLLGEEARIVGISGYTVRPRRAREEKPKVSAFLSAKIDKILALRARLRVRLFRPAGRHRGRADPPRRAGHGVQPAQRGRDFFHAVPGGGDGGAGASRAWRGSRRMRARLRRDRRRPRRACRAGRACSSRNGTSRTSAPSAGCRSWSASPAATTAFPSWPRSRWARTASSPTARRSCGATPTSSSAPGAARNSGPRRWRRGRAGRTCTRCATASCSRSSRPTSCSPARPR